jgi:methylthioribose-1-phosphate isomerase
VGVAVATSLADEGLDVTLTSDAALAFELHRWDADVLLVGADGVLPEGHVVNKAGTRGAAAAAAYEGIEVVVAAATDTVDPTRSDPADVDLDAGSMGRLADRETDPPEANPTFDVTRPPLDGRGERAGGGARGASRLAACGPGVIGAGSG